MSGQPSSAAAHHVRSAADYERRLRGAMRLASGKTRKAVVAEICTGIDAQVKAAGGDFARVAPSLDDPAWVGRQMVKVYGVALWAKCAALALVALLALASVPGLVAQPADGAPAIAAALTAFAALVVLLFLGGARASPVTGAIGGATAAALRTVGFMLPQGALSPLENSTGGEVALFFVATALLVVVAVVPALALRSRAADD